MIAPLLAIPAWSLPRDQNSARPLQLRDAGEPRFDLVSQPAPGSPQPPSVEPGCLPQGSYSLPVMGECHERRQAIAGYFLLGYEQAPLRGVLLTAVA